MSKAIFVSKVNSHPFEDRVFLLDQPAKIGRSHKDDVADSSNAYFDCKVLSRQHALLLYENGHFYLVDTKSSNGTFVNNIRLSKSGEESKLTEIFSNDILRFGSDIVDKSRQITQKCIIGKIRLFHTDGTDVGPRPQESRLFRPTDSFEDLHSLSQSLQESLMREKQLEDKLIKVKTMISKHIGRSQSDLIRIFEDVKEELINLYQEREALDTQSDAYDKLASENVQLTRRIHELERDLDNRIQQLNHLHKNNQTGGIEVMTLKKACQLQKQDIQSTEAINQQLMFEMDKQRKEFEQQLAEIHHSCENRLQSQEDIFNEEKTKLREQLQDITKNEINLLNKIKSYESDEDYARSEIDRILCKEREFTEQNQVLQYKLDCLQEELLQAYQKIEEQKNAVVVQRSEEDIEKIADLGSTIAKLNRDMAYLKQELIEARAHKSASDDELGTIKGKLETLENTISSLSEEGNRLRKIIGTLEDENAACREDANHMRSLVQKMEASSNYDEMHDVQLTDLRNDLSKREEALNLRNDDILMLKRDLRLKDETIQQLEIEISCLRGQLSNFECEVNAMKVASTGVTALKEDNNRLISQLETIQKDFSHTLQENNRLANDLQRQHSLYTELKKMRGRGEQLDLLQTMEQQLDEAQYKAVTMEQQLNQQDEQLQILKDERLRLLNELKGADGSSYKEGGSVTAAGSPSQAAIRSMGRLRLYEIVLGLFFIGLMVNWNWSWYS